MKPKTCILVRTKDKRKFLTEEENIPMLKEFSETFKAEVLLVKLLEENSKVKTLPLAKLAPAFCDSNYDQTPPNHEVIRRVFPKRTRSSIRKDAAKIQKYIVTKLTSGKSVSLKELKEKFKDSLVVTDACLCNHLTMARKKLIDDGYSIIKKGAGTYCLNGLKK